MVYENMIDSSDNVKSGEQHLSIVIVGHVDHGKSTIIGRLLADTDSLPEGRLEQVREKCRRNSKPFEYAFLLDALKDEQEQGITIDSARCFFKTQRRKYIIIDAPGHVEFIRNMVTGAARADAALLVIDAEEGIKENSKRHGYLLSILGIRQIGILINKMDLIDYREDAYWNLVEEYTAFLREIGLTPSFFIPVSGREGENIAFPSRRMRWYQGSTVLQALDELPAAALPVDLPMRMPVQGVYKFTKNGDNRRIVAGTVETGQIKAGDEVVFYPSGKRSRVKTIEVFNSKPPSEVKAGSAAGFTLAEEIYVKRGEVAALATEGKPFVGSRLRVLLFWLGKEPLVKEKKYVLKLGTVKAGVRLEEIVRVFDPAELKNVDKTDIGRHEVAECILQTEKAIAFDIADRIPQTGRFVLIDDYEISGGGIIQQGLEDKYADARENVFLRNFKWEASLITAEERAERYSQKPAVVLVTGPRGKKRKTVAKTLEKRLFYEGKTVYFLGMGNVLYGLDADIRGKSENHAELMRRLAEVIYIMLEAGLILIITAVELSCTDLEWINAAVDQSKVHIVWVGDAIPPDLCYDLHIPLEEDDGRAAAKIKSLLQERGIVFKP